MMRDGFLSESELGWTLEVVKKGYDVLIDSIPWNIGLIKYPWMDKQINIIWR